MKINTASNAIFFCFILFDNIALGITIKCLILSICSSAFKLRAGTTYYGNEVASCSNDCLGGSPL